MGYHGKEQSKDLIQLKRTAPCSLNIRSSQFSLMFQDSWVADPWRRVVLDLQAKEAVKKTAVQSQGKYAVMAVHMTSDADKLEVRFGTGPCMRLVSRQCLALRH